MIPLNLKPETLQLIINVLEKSDPTGVYTMSIRQDIVDQYQIFIKKQQEEIKKNQEEQKVKETVKK